MTKHGSGTPGKFHLAKKARVAGTRGVWGAASAGLITFMTFPEPYTLPLRVAIGFIAVAGGYLHGDWVAYRYDEPLPVFDHGTTLLFDVVVAIVCLLLFVFPALQLDNALQSEAYLTHLPGWFGFAAMYLSALLMPVLRGLICNLGLARQEGETSSLYESGA